MGLRLAAVWRISAVNLHLFLAAIWGALAAGILLFWPSVEQNPMIGLESERRLWLGGFAMVLVGYNMVRWRLARLRRQADEDARAMQTPIRPRHRDEPPNPDFDFSDPKPPDSPQDPPVSRPGST